jgi:hypothetical protein
MPFSYNYYEIEYGNKLTSSNIQKTRQIASPKYLFTNLQYPILLLIKDSLFSITSSAFWHSRKSKIRYLLWVLN